MLLQPNSTKIYREWRPWHPAYSPPTPPASFDTIKALPDALSSILRPTGSERPRYAKPDCIVTSNRADAVLLNRLRAGYTPLKACAHLIEAAADCAWKSRKQWNTGCRDARTWISSGNVPPVALLGVLTTASEKVLALSKLSKYPGLLSSQRYPNCKSTPHNRAV